MIDPFIEAAKHIPDEGPQFESLPAGAWVLGRTATKENGKAAPEVRTFDINKGPNAGGVFYKFSVGLLAEGGDKALKPKKHRNGLVFFGQSVHPGPQEPDKMTLSGRLTGFLNSVFGPGIGVDEEDEERHKLRWHNTLKVLGKVRDDNSISVEDYVTYTDGVGDDEKRLKYEDLDEGQRKYTDALYFAGIAVVALEDESRKILFKTRKDSKTDRIVPAQVEDDIEAHRMKRKVTEFEEPEEGSSW